MSVLVLRTPTTLYPSSLTFGTVSQQHPWINRLAIFLDNATSTNKNKYLFSWAMEMVSSGELDHIHISFMIAGHTKFAPDRLFSTIGCAYKTEDVFTIGDLKSICDRSATCHIETGEQILMWRNTLGEKYSDLPGVRRYHDFLVVKAHDGSVVMKVRENCFSGSWKDSPLRIRNSSLPGVPTETYKDTQRVSLQKRWQIWSLCMIASYLLIAGQTTCHPRVLLFVPPVLLLHLHSRQLARLERESRANALRRGVMVLDTRILPDGLQVTPPKPAVRCKRSSLIHY